MTLTAVSCLLSFLTVPALVTAGFFFWLDDQPEIEIPPTTLSLQLVVLVVFPIAIGMTLRKWRPTKVESRDLLLRRCSLSALIVLVTIIVIDQRASMVANLGSSAIVAFAFTALSMAAGFLLAWVTGRPAADRLTYLIEFSCRNLALVVMIGVTVLGRPDLVTFARCCYSSRRWSYCRWCASCVGTDIPPDRKSSQTACCGRRFIRARRVISTDIDAPPPSHGDASFVRTTASLPYPPALTGRWAMETETATDSWRTLRRANSPTHPRRRDTAPRFPRPSATYRLGRPRSVGADNDEGAHQGPLCARSRSSPISISTTVEASMGRSSRSSSIRTSRTVAEDRSISGDSASIPSSSFCAAQASTVSGSSAGA